MKVTTNNDDDDDNDDNNNNNNKFWSTYKANKIIKSPCILCAWTCLHVYQSHFPVQCFSAIHKQY